MIRCSKVSFLWLKASDVFVYGRQETGRHFGLSFQLTLIPYCTEECLRVLTLLQSTDWEVHLGDHGSFCAAQARPAPSADGAFCGLHGWAESACHICGQIEFD